VDDYRRAAAQVTAAFAAADVVRDRFAVHELGSGAFFPAVQAISFHFVDYLVQPGTSPARLMWPSGRTGTCSSRP